VGELVADLLAGEHRALARVISMIEDRSPGYRDVVSELHRHSGTADVVGVTGSPGAGKSTLVDKVAATYRERGETVGVIAIDPSSPFTGGAVLGDRIQNGLERGRHGRVLPVDVDARVAGRPLDGDYRRRHRAGRLRQGQDYRRDGRRRPERIDVVRTADTVAVLVPPDSGDDVQMLKAGILGSPTSSSSTRPTSTEPTGRWGS